MNSLITILLGSTIIIPVVYFFSTTNKTFKDYKKYIERFDHKFEEFEVITEDGYILSLWHLVPDFHVNKEKVVFFQPGFADTSAGYFELGEKSLPYFLQEKGYDIWLGNNRGSPPSKKHVSKNPKKENGDYWDFCMDDFVKYDIVSEINYIKKHTGAKKVDFIGYSEGSTLFLMLYMDNPNFVENSINKFVSIGTVPNLSDIPTSVTELIDKVSYYLKIKEFFSKVFSIDDKARTALITSVEKEPTYLYNHLLKKGVITRRTNYKVLIHFLSHYPVSTSIYNLYQWEEIQDNKKLVYYKPNSDEFDEVKEYDYSIIKKWKIRSLITRSVKDSFSSYNEVTKLYQTIENKNLITIFDCDYAHLDFALAESAYEDFYIPVALFLEGKN